MVSNPFALYLGFFIWNFFSFGKGGLDSSPFILLGGVVFGAAFGAVGFLDAAQKRVAHIMPLPLIVLEAGLQRKITDTYFANLEDLSLSVRGDGIGTIDFTPSAVLERLRNDQIVDLRTVNFYDIEDAAPPALAE